MERHLTELDAMRFPSRYSRDDFSLVEREAARLQAEVTRDLAASLWRGIRKTASAVAWIFTVIAKASAASRLYNELNRMDDATLANLGLSRETIPQVVAASMDDDASRWPTAAPATALRKIDGEAPGDAVADNDLTHRRAA